MRAQKGGESRSTTLGKAMAYRTTSINHRNLGKIGSLWTNKKNSQNYTKSQNQDLRTIVLQYTIGSYTVNRTKKEAENL